MVAALAIQQPDPKRLHLVTEFRGAVGRLFREHSGEIVISGPAGTGKTRSILEWLNLRCAQEPLRVLFLRKTLESLKTSALVTFTEKVLHDFDGKRSAADGVTYFGGNHIRPASFTYEQTGSTIVIGGMDNPTKILSTEYDIIYVNECTELTLDEWERLGNRTDRPDTNQSRPASLLLGDCNPDAPRHWIKKRLAEGHLQLWLTTHKDNPAMWDRIAKSWTPSGERYMERLQRLTGVRRQRLLLGVWAASEGQVYTEFDPERHVQSIDTTFWTTYMAVDVGSRNPTAILTAHHREGDDHLHVSHEVYRRGMTSTDILDAIKAEADRSQPYDIFIDPSAKAYIDDLRRAGYPAKPAVNDVLVGIQRVHGVLGHGFSADPSCSNLIDEFGMYSYPDNPKLELDKPVKDNDHAMDALRYLCVGIFGEASTELHLPTGALADYLATAY